MGVIDLLLQTAVYQKKKIFLFPHTAKKLPDFIIPLFCMSLIITKLNLPMISIILFSYVLLSYLVLA